MEFLKNNHLYFVDHCFACLFLLSIKYADSGPSSRVNFTSKTGSSTTETCRKNLDKRVGGNTDNTANRLWVRVVDFQPQGFISEESYEGRGRARSQPCGFGDLLLSVYP